MLWHFWRNKKSEIVFPFYCYERNTIPSRPSKYTKERSKESAGRRIVVAIIIKKIIWHMEKVKKTNKNVFTFSIW